MSGIQIAGGYPRENTLQSQGMRTLIGVEEFSMKESVVAARDIKKGEVLTRAVAREEGYFYFFDGEGNAMRAQHARKKLTPEQRASKERALGAYKKAVQERKNQREHNRSLKLKALADGKAAHKRAREAKIEAKIASLQQKKAKL